jgi:hypothetical protein
LPPAPEPHKAPNVLDGAIGLLRDGAASAVLGIVGDSMRPTLLPGDEVRVDLSPRPPRFGELLLFRQADYLVVHRYLGPARRPDGTPCLRTRGDGRIVLDPALDPAGVRGRAVAFRRGGAWRTLQGAGPRAWAIAVGAHAWFWSALASVLPVRRVAAAADRGLLLAASALAFKIVHRVEPGPSGAPDGESKLG